MTFPVSYEETGNDSGKALIPLPEGGYILLGTTTNPSTNIKNIFLALVEESNLNPVGSKSLGGNINHVAACIKRTPEVNLVITGTYDHTYKNQSRRRIIVHTSKNLN